MGLADEGRAHQPQKFPLSKISDAVLVSIFFIPNKPKGQQGAGLTTASTSFWSCTPCLPLEPDSSDSEANDPSANEKQVSLIAKDLILRPDQSAVSLLAYDLAPNGKYMLGVEVYRGDGTILLTERLDEEGNPDRHLFAFTPKTKLTMSDLAEGRVSTRPVSTMTDILRHHRGCTILSSSSWEVSAEKIEQLNKKLLDYRSHKITPPKFMACSFRPIQGSERNCLTFFQERLAEIEVDAKRKWCFINLFFARPQDHIGHTGDFNCLEPVSREP